MSDDMEGKLEEARQEISDLAAVGEKMGVYRRRVRSEVIDVYDVLAAFNVTNPATAHAIKKLLAPGKRGHKDAATDLSEAMASLQRAIEIERESES